ncbi:MAG: hypothetical protein E7224_06900, partial [Clostridiales bacterium]|nr:hypothetical protein [Clostridiales bacterium]
WDRDLSLPITGDVTIRALYNESINEYTVIWKNHDGTVLETDHDVVYGTTPSYDGAVPEKTGDAQYSYSFTGWSPMVSAVTGNVEYTAQFGQSVNKYTITFKNWDGTVLQSQELEYGAMPGYAATPVKPGDAQHSWTFTGWSPAVAPVTGDQTYTAQFGESVNGYTVTWKNYDGTVLETDLNVLYGTTPSYDSADPVKPGTARYSYTWTGWTPAVSSVTGDATYTAEFSSHVNSYEITWKNWDGSVLRVDTLEHGATPNYGSDPVRAGDAQYTWHFIGWSPTVTTVTGTAAYQAVYSSSVNDYVITYTDGVDHSVVFADQTYTAAYGDATPAFSGTPSRSGYTFEGWQPVVAATVSGHATYAAQWTLIPSGGGGGGGPVIKTEGSAKLIKVDASDASTKLAGVIFELHKADGSLMGTYTTDANGQILADSLSTGGYYWLEIRPAEGYLLDGLKHSFTVAAGQTATMTVTNTHSGIPSDFSTEHYAYIIGNNGKVRPMDNATRAEVATIFFRLLDEDVRNRYMVDTNSFSDVHKGQWYNTAISTMAAMGIVQGYPDGSFRPDEKITRAEFTAIVARFDSYGSTEGHLFSDVSEHWAYSYINVAVNNGWILGYEDGTFRPNRNITRAEIMTLANRVLQRIPEATGDLLKGMITWADNMDTSQWYYLAVQEATNTHDYGRKSNGFEYWTLLTESPDWTLLQK